MRFFEERALMRDITEFLRQTLKEAGAVLHEGFRTRETAYERKGAVDLVTKWDMQSEQVIRERILKQFPTHALCGEEGGGTFTQDGYLWVVDPLDGTTNFVHKHPYYSVSIACCKDGVPIVGGVYAPESNELFLAERGGGAYCNDEKIRVSEVAQLDEALFVTGYPYKREGKIERAQTILANALHSVQCIRRMGSAALDLCHVASGMFDVYIEFDLRPWDIAAGSLVLQEAGGMISLCSGGEFCFRQGEVLATNARLHTAAFEQILAGVS
jgi:myo-inositol-1(or 4)-monophosphatase